MASGALSGGVLILLLSALFPGSRAVNQKPQVLTFAGVEGSWTFKLKGTDAEYRYRAGRYQEKWWASELWGELHGRHMSYSGTLRRSYAVAGEAIDEEQDFTLDLIAQPCSNRKGRVLPVTASLTLRKADDPSYKLHGCGNAVAVATIK